MVETSDILKINIIEDKLIEQKEYCSHVNFIEIYQNYLPHFLI